MVGSLLFGVASCSTKGSSAPSPDTFDYSSLYEHVRQPYQEKAYGALSACYGYVGNSAQGYNSWYYLEKNAATGVYSEMSFDSVSSSFRGNGSSFSLETAVAALSYYPVRRYVCTRSGFVKIYGNISVEDGSGKLSVLHNGVLLTQVSVQKGDYRYYEATVTVSIGDQLDFSLEGDIKASFDPSIVYESEAAYSLYHLTPEGKYYGDLFPYYDTAEKQLYLYYLHSDDARNGAYLNSLDVSSDFLTYTNVPEENQYAIWNHYKENGNLALVRDCSRYIDQSKYAFGIRDHSLIFDAEKKRYLLIAGCYHEFDSEGQTSDLVVYESNDELGFDWNPVGNVIASYSRNLPECPGLMKIGKRWYAFTSVAYNTAHQVGPLQYWMGDENEDIMDIDFSKKSFSFVDGEDLCAARVFGVGEKSYAFGWIPRTYNTMPWAPWGGYLNLPRQIVQHADGTLGGRMDPGLKEKLDYGNIATFSTLKVGSTETPLTKNLERNLVSLHLSLNGSSKFSYLFRQNDRDFLLSIEKRDNKAYLNVTSPEDPSHVNNSEIEIPLKDSYDLSFANDGEFIEAFVNDEYGLSAHTAMKNEPYDGYLVSDNEAQVTNVSIEKLTPYWNLY